MRFIPISRMIEDLDTPDSTSFAVEDIEGESKAAMMVRKK
jgi:hypothetical protein